MLFVERHYLVHYSASFSEHFYGLKRRKVLSKGGGGAREERTKAAYELTGKSDKLGRKEIRGSLAFLVSILCPSSGHCRSLCYANVGPIAVSAD